MHILHGLGKTEQLVREMKCYRLSILAVTETHLSEEGGMMVLAEESGYTVIFSGRQDEHYMEGVGLALTPHAGATMQYHQAVSECWSFADCRGICSYQPGQHRRERPVLL